MAKHKTPKKIMGPIDIVINRDEFRQAGKQLDMQAAQVMRMLAGLGIDPRMTPDSVEGFLQKKGL